MRLASYQSTRTDTQEFVVGDLRAAEAFWDPFMAYVGWRRVEAQDDVVEYAGATGGVVFEAGQPWDSVVNEANRASPFGHLVFELETLAELESLAQSIRNRRQLPVGSPEAFLDGERWFKGIVVSDPNGLQVEVRAAA